MRLHLPVTMVEVDDDTMTYGTEQRLKVTLTRGSDMVWYTTFKQPRIGQVMVVEITEEGTDGTT